MTQITMLDPPSVLAFTGTGAIVGIDLSGFDTEADYISVSLPEFPASKLDLELTSIALTSNEDGAFDIGPTDQVSFSLSTTDLVDDDCELRLPLSLFNTVDLSVITGVRFQVEAIEECTFRATAIRCIASDWTFAPIDLDTLYNEALRPPAPNGALYSPIEFPSASTEWPVVFRSDEPTSSKDPMPIDLSIGAAIATGSLTAATGIEDSGVSLVEGDSILGGNYSAFNFAGSFSLEVWVKPSDMDNGPIGLIKKWDDATGKRGWRLSFNTSGQIVFDWTTDGDTMQRVISQTADIKVDEWNHIVLTFEKPASGTNTITLYHNGRPVGQTTGISNQAVASTSESVKIGTWA